MKSIKILFLLFLVTLGSKIFGQFNWAEIGVDGLTCSACTRSVEMSIRKLAFVDSVIMNLEHTEGKIIFKKDSKPDMEKVAKAVTDAGFSLRSLYAGINIDHLKVTNESCWNYENATYHFIKIPESKELKGQVTFKFIGEKFMPKKEYKNWKIYCANSCVSSSISYFPVSKNYYVSLL